MAQVAMSYGINGNAVHRWRQLALEGQAFAAITSGFIALPVAMPDVSLPSPADIRVELRRDPIAMIVTWPANAAADFATWTCELLR